jgi:hypothetical protein
MHLVVQMLLAALVLHELVDRHVRWRRRRQLALVEKTDRTILLLQLGHGHHISLARRIQLESTHVQLLVVAVISRLLELSLHLGLRLGDIVTLEGVLVLHELEQQHLKHRRHVPVLVSASHEIVLELHLILALLLLVLLYGLGSVILVQHLLQLLGLVDVFGVRTLDHLHLQEQVLQVLGQLAVVGVLRAQFEAGRGTLQQLLLESGGALRHETAHERDIGRVSTQASSFQRHLAASVVGERILYLVDQAHYLVVLLVSIEVRRLLRLAQLSQLLLQELLFHGQMILCPTHFVD